MSVIVLDVQMEKSQEENDQSNSTSSKSPISIHTQNISPLNKKTKFPTLLSLGRKKEKKKRKTGFACGRFPEAKLHENPPQFFS